MDGGDGNQFLRAALPARLPRSARGITEAARCSLLAKPVFVPLRSNDLRLGAWRNQLSNRHLVAIRKLCNCMVTSGVLPCHPTASVRGPKHRISFELL